MSRVISPVAPCIGVNCNACFYFLKLHCILTARRLENCKQRRVNWISRDRRLAREWLPLVESEMQPTVSHHRFHVCSINPLHGSVLNFIGISCSICKSIIFDGEGKELLRFLIIIFH